MHRGKSRAGRSPPELPRRCIALERGRKKQGSGGRRERPPRQRRCERGARSGQEGAKRRGARSPPPPLPPSFRSAQGPGSMDNTSPAKGPSAAFGGCRCLRGGGGRGEWPTRRPIQPPPNSHLASILDTNGVPLCLGRRGKGATAPPPPPPWQARHSPQVPTRARARNHGRIKRRPPIPPPSLPPAATAAPPSPRGPLPLPQPLDRRRCYAPPSTIGWATPKSPWEGPRRMGGRLESERAGGRAGAGGWVNGLGGGGAASAPPESTHGGRAWREQARWSSATATRLAGWTSLALLSILHLYFASPSSGFSVDELGQSCALS